ncbi:MAG: pirin family protein [Alphaproteobacteria bacterium]|nr:pirin family protein [Alphaproteobacteria bacterium]
MIERRPFATLGRFQNDWLNARHHFSFASYYDPARMSVGKLRVWNDDQIQAGTGFDPHPHRDMEIITYVREGAITHEDSLGNRGRTEAGDVQVMSAGTGIRHAEYNLEDGPTTLFQIWIEPARLGVKPRWDAKPFPKGDRAGRWVTLASGRPDGGDALVIHQDAAVLGATVLAGTRLDYALGAGRHGYLVAPKGRFTVDGQPIEARDGVVLGGGETHRIEAVEDTELVLVDVP